MITSLQIQQQNRDEIPLSESVKRRKNPALDVEFELMPSEEDWKNIRKGTQTIELQDDEVLLQQDQEVPKRLLQLAGGAVDISGIDAETGESVKFVTLEYTEGKEILFGEIVWFLYSTYYSPS